MPRIGLVTLQAVATRDAGDLEAAALALVALRQFPAQRLDPVDAHLEQLG